MKTVDNIKYYEFLLHTVCQKIKSWPIYVVNNYIKRAKTSWTNSTFPIEKTTVLNDRWILNLLMGCSNQKPDPEYT